MSVKVQIKIKRVKVWFQVARNRGTQPQVERQTKVLGQRVLKVISNKLSRVKRFEAFLSRGLNGRRNR